MEYARSIDRYVFFAVIRIIFFNGICCFVGSDLRQEIVKLVGQFWRK